MKKVISLILSLMLMIGMCSFAFAAEVDGDVEEAELFAALEEKEADEEEAADSEEAVDTIGAVDLVSFDQSFIAVYLKDANQDVAILNIDGNNTRGCISKDGIVKLNRNEEAKTYCVVLNNTEFKAKNVKKVENTNGLVLEFFLGAGAANKDFVLYNENGDTVELKADAEGFCAVSVKDAKAFALIEKTDGALSFADIAAAEIENSENQYAGQENKSNLPITIAFFCLLAIGGGYLVWDKFFKGRNKASDDDDE